jgi:hypothetical protein
MGSMKDGKIPNRNEQLLSQPNRNIAELKTRRLVLASFFLGVLFNLEVGGDVFPRNVGIFLTYMTLHLRRPYSPYPSLRYSNPMK